MAALPATTIRSRLEEQRHQTSGAYAQFRVARHAIVAQRLVDVAAAVDYFAIAGMKPNGIETDPATKISPLAFFQIAT